MKTPIEMGSMPCFHGGRDAAAGARHTDTSGAQARPLLEWKEVGIGEEALCVGARD